MGTEISIACSLEDTLALARVISKKLGRGDVVILIGGLGAGKTTLASEIVRSIVGGDCVVNSPTYQIIKTYKSASIPVAHVDLYRIKDVSELLHIGFTDLLDDFLLLIEWPEVAMSLIGSVALSIGISDSRDDQSRVITLAFADGDRWSDLRSSLGLL